MLSLLSRLFLYLVVLAGSIGSASCGYALAGQGNFLPAYIRTIGVPAFTNATSYFDIGQIITDKVRTQFIGRGKYQVVPEATGADAVLVGTITAITIVPTAFAAGQQASRYVITMIASIELRDVQKDTALWTNPAMVVREEYEASASSDVAGTLADPTSFFNREADAVQRVSDEFARTVVTSILEAF